MHVIHTRGLSYREIKHIGCKNHVRKTEKF